MVSGQKGQRGPVPKGKSWDLSFKDGGITLREQRDERQTGGGREVKKGERSNELSRLVSLGEERLGIAGEKIEPM